MVEIPNHTDAQGIWRPDGKKSPLRTVDGHKVSAQLFIDRVVDTCIKLLNILG